MKTILLLTISNAFMNLAWYGHLKFKDQPLWLVILASWGLALFEYIFQVPANRIGYESNGGPFNMFELKIIQEVISVSVFSFFAIYIFKTDKLEWNYIVGFIFLLLAVFFIFKKW